MDPQTLIQAETEVVAPPLVPELRLHLVTERCRLWRYTEPDLEALGLPLPFWAFCWPGGQALARYLLDHPGEVAGRSVLDFGAGGAVEGLAASRAGATRVLAADIDRFAVHCTQLNARLNGLEVETTTEDLVGKPQPGFQVVLAGDVCYEAPFAERVHAWLRELARGGARVLIADPNRGFLPGDGLLPVAQYDAPADGDLGGTIRKRTTVFVVEG